MRRGRYRLPGSLRAQVCAACGLALLAAAPVPAAERVKPIVRLAPEVIEVAAGNVSEPLEVSVTWPAGAGAPPDALPLDIRLPRQIQSFIEVEAEPRQLSFGRGSVATAAVRFHVDPETPRARYRLIVAAGLKPVSMAVMVLDVENVRGLPPGSAVSQENEVSAAVPVAATAQLAFSSVSGSDTASIALGPVKQTVYGSELEMPPDLVTIVPDAQAWDRHARLAWKSAHADKFEWEWQVSLQPFPASQSAVDPSTVLAAGPVPGKPAAGGVNSFSIDFGKLPLLGEPPLTAAESANDTVAVVPGLSSPDAASPDGSGSRAATPSGRSDPSSNPDPPAGGAGSEVLVLPDDPSLPEFAMDLHIRLLPRLPDGQSGGPPSNSVVLHYEPGVNPAAVQALEQAKEVASVAHALEALEEQAAKLYELQILEYRPVVFEDPNRWGCVEFVETPPQGFANLAGYQPGDEACPEAYKGKGDNFDPGDLDPIEIAEELADFVSGLYDDLKQGFLDLAMKAVPCPSDLEGACRAALSTALDAALASAGIPPSLPDFDELQAAAKGELTELATQAALNELPGGVACRGIPQCETELRNAISKGIDQGLDVLTATSKEPHCGNVAEAHAHGREPLPCYNQMPGFKVEPAKGAVYEPFTVTVRAARTAAPMPDGLDPAACKVVIGLSLSNQYPGGKLGGSVDYQIVPATELSGQPFHPVAAPLPPLGPNQSTTVTLAFTEFTQYRIPGFNTLQHPYKPMEHWFPLYSKGTGTLEASTSANASVLQGDEPAATKAVKCGPPAPLAVEMPAGNE